jgi:pSer/pThr/pTyr-binding forkhead associated (FHA) protein
MISGKHLVIKINSESRVVIKDLDTTNGTYLNGNKIQETFLYVEDFVQIGKVKIILDDSEMSAKELALHKRDFERTNVTFVRLGSQVEGVEDFEEDEFGQSRQKTLLAKIRRKKEIDENIMTTTANVSDDDQAEPPTQPKKESLPEEDLELKADKKVAKKVTRKKKIVKDHEKGKESLLGKLKGIFKK